MLRKLLPAPEALRVRAAERRFHSGAGVDDLATLAGVQQRAGAVGACGSAGDEGRGKSLANDGNGFIAELIGEEGWSGRKRALSRSAPARPDLGSALPLTPP